MAMLKTITELGREEAKSIEEDVKEHLLNIAVQRTGVPRERWLIRDILPKTDLELSTESWSFDYSTANSENLVINKQLPQRKFIAFFGVAVRDPEPAAVYIKFATGAGGATVKDIIHLEDLYVKREPDAWLEEPIVYEQQDWVKIYVYPSKVKTGEKLILKGYVAEIKGELITE